MRQICPVCGVGYAGPKTMTTCGRHTRREVLLVEQKRIAAEAAEDLRLWLLQDVH